MEILSEAYRQETSVDPLPAFVADRSMVRTGLGIGACMQYDGVTRIYCQRLE